MDNPYSGDTYCTVTELTAQEANTRVAAAAKAFGEFKRVPIEKRVELCDRCARAGTAAMCRADPVGRPRRFCKAFEANAGKIAADITGQMGKPFSQARGEINTMLNRARAMMKLAPQVLAEEALPAEPNQPFRKITHEPIGPVLVLAPWNYPLLCAVNVVVPAILAGNTVLLKHSTRTPLCADHFVDAFKEAGAPADVIQTLQCNHDVISSTIRHPDIAYVSFTGSVPGGHQVYRSVSERFIDAVRPRPPPASLAGLTRVVRAAQGLELGGCDAAYVREDADIEKAADGVVDGAFYNAGQARCCRRGLCSRRAHRRCAPQSCCGVQRVYVHQKVYDAFVAKSLDLVRGYNMGDPMKDGTTLGPLAQKNGADDVKRMASGAEGRDLGMCSRRTRARRSSTPPPRARASCTTSWAPTRRARAASSHHWWSTATTRWPS